MQSKDLVSAKPARTHMTHPHGVRVFMLLEEMMAGIAKAAASRNMVFHVTPSREQTVPGRYRDSWLVWRQHTPQGVVQIPLFECIVELTQDHPERKAVRSPLNLRSVSQAQGLLSEFTDAHLNHVYGGCGLVFNELEQIMRKVVAITECYCMVQVAKLPHEAEPDEQLRNMAVLTFVLKDELYNEAGIIQPYDYQITFIWNGPMRWRRLLEQAYGIGA